jgi:hypothetical protein
MACPRGWTKDPTPDIDRRFDLAKERHNWLSGEDLHRHYRFFLRQFCKPLGQKLITSDTRATTVNEM